MRGLMADGSFVGSGKIISKKREKGNLKSLAIALLVIGILSGSIVFVTASNLSSPNSQYLGYRVVKTDIGPGYKQPTVCSIGNYFVVAYYNDKGYLNVTSINSQTGEQVLGFPRTISTDVDKYRRTAIDTDGASILVVWRLNSNGSLYGQFLNSTGFPDPTRPAFQINDSATTVGTTDFDVIGIKDHGAYVVVWSDSSYHNHYRVIKDTSPVEMGSIGDISADSNSHARNQGAYDPSTGNVMIVWRRYNSTGIYNVTGRIFSVDTSGLSLTPITSDFTIGDGTAVNTQYDYPSIAGGGGYFFVGYTDYNSPYNISGRLIDASNGDMSSVFQIGSTAKYGRSFLGIAYNGSGFTVAWTDSSYDIVARNYDVHGNPATPIQTIAGTSDSEETQDVAVDTLHKTYYFVWYDYTNKHDYGALWTENEFVPELWITGIIAVPLLVIIIRKKH